MNKAARFGTVILSLAAAGAVFAQAPAPVAPAPADQAKHAQFGSVDQNKDGRVSQTEAQINTELKSSFTSLDTDKDTYLSQSEFAKWHAGKAGDMPKKPDGASSYSAPQSEPVAEPEAK